MPVPMWWKVSWTQPPPLACAWVTRDCISARVQVLSSWSGRAGVEGIRGRQRFSKREGLGTCNLAPDVAQATGAVVAARCHSGFGSRVCRGKRIREILDVQSVSQSAWPGHYRPGVPAHPVLRRPGRRGSRCARRSRSGGLQRLGLGRRHIVRLVQEAGGQEERPAHAQRMTSLSAATTWSTLASSNVSVTTVSPTALAAGAVSPIREAARATVVEAASQRAFRRPGGRSALCRGSETAV